MSSPQQGGGIYPSAPIAEPPPPYDATARHPGSAGDAAFKNGVNIPLGNATQMPPIPGSVYYPPQPQGHLPPLNNGSTTIHTVFVPAPFGPYSQDFFCTKCNSTVQTRVQTKAGLMTYLFCGVLAFFACWPCCLIPFCCASTQDVEHSCPRCGRYFGVFKRM